MSDILFSFVDGQVADITIDGPDLKGGDPLLSAVVISIFTDRRAEPDDETQGEYRGGWWADTFPEVEGDRIGSRLWLLAREKQTEETLTRAREYVIESLQWLIEDGVAASVDVETVWIREQVMGCGVTITRPDGTTRNMNFDYAWEQRSAA